MDIFLFLSKYNLLNNRISDFYNKPSTENAIQKLAKNEF